MLNNKSKVLICSVLLLVILASFIAGFGIIGFATTVGPWAYSDSTSYIIAASNLANGKGLTVQDTDGNYSYLTWHPPLFPILISLPMGLNVDALQSARWINAFLFAVLAAFSVWFTWKFSRSIIVSATVGVLFLFSPDLIRVFSGAMSEGIFLVCGFLGLFLLTKFFTHKKRPWVLAVAGILIGLSYLARYTGIAFITTGFLALMIFEQARLSKRITNLIIYCISAGLFPLIWMIRVFSLTSSFGGRSVKITVPISQGFQEYFHDFFTTIGNWIPFFYRGNHILPTTSKLVLGCVLLISATFILWWLGKKRNIIADLKPVSIWAAVLILFMLNYIAFHIVSFLFSNARPDVNWRLLSPVLIAGYLGVPMLFVAYSAVIKPAWITSLIFLSLSLITVWYLHGKTEQLLFEMHNYGEGYTSKRWQNHEVFSIIKNLQGDQKIMSNDPALILFYTGIYPKMMNLKDLEQGSFTFPSDQVYLVIFYPQADNWNDSESMKWFAQYQGRVDSIFESQNAKMFLWTEANH